MVMELHVWGTPEEIAIINPDCLIAIWYMSLTIPHSDFKIITSSNINLSNNGELPILRTLKDGQFDGVSDLIRYLVEQGFDLNKGLSKEQRALNDGIFIFLKDKFKIITDYTLYLNKLNYEDYTRSVFRQYLSFPLQYNTPLQYRSHAKKNCQRVGLTVEDKTEVEEEMLQNVPTVSKVQQMKHESMIEDKLVLKNSLTNMKCLNLITEYIDIIINLQKELGTQGQEYIFGSISTADLVFLAHLYIQTHQHLSDQFITKFLEVKYPGLLPLKKQLLTKIEQKLETVIIEGPGFNDSPNLINLVRYGFV